MKNLLFLPLALVVIAATGQDVASIQKELKNIQTVKYSVDQQVTSVSGTVVDFRLDLVGRGGSHNATVYRVDLADLDPYRLRGFVTRGLMKLEIFSKANERMVTEIKDGEIKRFITNFSVDVEGEDNRESLMEVLKTAIAKAEEKEKSRPGPSSIDAALKELCAIVKDVPKPDGEKQSLEYTNDDKVKLIHSVHHGGKYQLRYEVNLSSLNVEGAKLKATGDDVFIEVRTNRDERVIKLLENGLTKSFEYYDRYYASSIENAKEIRRLLKHAGKLNND